MQLPCNCFTTVLFCFAKSRCYSASAGVEWPPLVVQGKRKTSASQKRYCQVNPIRGGLFYTLFANRTHFLFIVPYNNYHIFLDRHTYLIFLSIKLKFAVKFKAVGRRSRSMIRLDS